MRVVLAALCLCWFAMAAAVSSSAAPLPMSAEEAVSVAERFAQKLNLPLTGAPKAEFLGSGRGFLAPPSWRLRFAGAIEIQVDADTGRVLRFDVFSRAAARRTQTDEQAISEGQAVGIATKVAEAMGRPADAVLRSVARYEYFNHWHVAWERRTPSGVPFYDDALTVYVGAASGQPTSAHMCWSSRVPESMEVRISRERAVELARRFATKRGPLLQKPTITAGLRIVHPNGHWTKKPLRHIRYDSPTRLAWVVEVKRKPAGWSGMVFWIDAADGSLLGGAEPPMGAFSVGRRPSSAK